MSGFCEVMGASSDREVWKIPVYGVPAVLFFGGVPDFHVNLFGVEPELYVSFSVLV